jgi:hypothetical protein
MPAVTPTLIGNAADGVAANTPTYPAYGRNPWYLVAFDDRVHIGLGNGSSRGPAGATNNNGNKVALIAYDPAVPGFVDESTGVLTNGVIASRQTGHHAPIITFTAGRGPELVVFALDPDPDDVVIYHRTVGGTWAAKSSGDGSTNHIYTLVHHSNTLVAGAQPVSTRVVTIVTSGGGAWPHSLTWTTGSGGSQALAAPSSFVAFGKAYVTLVVGTGAISGVSILEWDGSGTTTFTQPSNVKFAQWFPSTTADTSASARVYRPTVATLNGTEAVYYVAAKNVEDHQFLPYGNGLYRCTAISVSGAGSLTTSRIDLDTLLSATGVRVWDLLVDGTTLYALVEYTTGGGAHRAAVCSTTNGTTWAEGFYWTLPHADVFARSFALLDGVWYFGIGCGGATSPDTPYSAGAQAEVGDIYAYDTGITGTVALIIPVAALATEGDLSMANAPSITTAARSVAADAVVDLVDAGTPPGLLRIYSGTPPADVNAALSGNTLLAELTFSTTAFGAAASGVATAAAITSDSSANATGTATFFRVVNAAGTAIMQGTAGEAADNCDMTLSDKTITSGQGVLISSFTYTQSGS